MQALFFLVLMAGAASAASDVRVNFVLNTTDANGVAITQNRVYYVYRPDNLSKDTPVPVVLSMDAVATNLHRKADQAGFVVVSCTFSGNSSNNTGWVNDDPDVVGYEDYDYISEVINRVKASDNTSEVFLTGLSKGGHMTLAYACIRPVMITATSSVDEFMQLATNIPTAAVPVIFFHGTGDNSVPYTMVRDTMDAWRSMNQLMDATPVTTFENSPRLPGRVSQATWRGGMGGTQVAMVTIVGGTHTYATPGIETGYDFSDGLWAFFSQFIGPADGAPWITSVPVDNTQMAGQPASFWVTANGSGPLQYQWQRDGVNIDGATSNWYTLPVTTAADTGAVFRAVVTNDSGSVVSAEAKLTVVAAPAGPSIMVQPVDQSVYAGQPVRFSVTATGDTAVSYQWRKNGFPISGATAATLNIPVALTADSGAAISVIATNSAGSASSVPVTLAVLPAEQPPLILQNPERSRVLVGQSGSFSVWAIGDSSMTYQWQKGTFSSNMVNIVGATDATYTTPATTLTDHLTLFRCVVSNASGSAVSADEMLFVTASVAAPTSIDSKRMADTTIGYPFSYRIVSSGGTSPVLFNASPLPDGWTLDKTTGVITAKPTDIGTVKLTMEASNSAGHVSALLTVNVRQFPPGFGGR